MKRILSVLMTLFMTALLFGCGAPAGNNAAAGNANANKTAANTTATEADTAAAEAEIKKLMDTTQAALGKNDAEAMDKVYHEQYMLVNIDGSVQNRAERMASLRAGDVKYTAFSYTEPNIRVNPEATGAIVIAKLSMKGTFKGKAMDGEYRVTHVYRKTKDGWKLVTAQATKIEGGAAPAKADDKKAANTKADASDAAPAANK